MNFKMYLLMFTGAVLLAATGFPGQAQAFRPHPPQFVFSGPPALVVLPGLNVYIAPDIGVDIVFHQGYWWRPYGGHWYRSHSYNGPWGFMEQGRVPREVHGLPPNFRHAYHNYKRIPSRDVERNWRQWDRDRDHRQDRRPDYRQDHRQEHRPDRHDNRRDRDR